MKSETTTNVEYFASIKDPDELASKMQEKIGIWRNWCKDKGLAQLWRTKLTNYYGRSANGNSSHGVQAGGAEGELSLIKVNDLHQLLQEQLVVVTSQRPAGVAKAINSDTKSLKAARIGSAVAEYYMTEMGFESKFVQVTETALLCDEGFIDLYWNKSGGQPIAVDPETKIPEMSGDPGIRTHCPWNVARDPGVPIDRQKWKILSFRENKFDLAMDYPRFYDEIVTTADDGLPDLELDHIPADSDAIYVHLLVHDRTSAIPNGRYALMIGDEIVLDTELPFSDYPVERMAPSDVIDGPIGYAAANDILALEEVTDGFHSIITTNGINFGGQCIVGPTGADIKVSDLAKGVRYFELAPDLVDKLKPLEMVRTPKEIFEYVGLLGGKKEKAVGSVSNVLSQQAAHGASGSSMALIQTQAISFNSGTQRSYFKLLSGTMTKLIAVLRVYADQPKIARIVGKSKAMWLKEFKYTGQDLNSISSIVYELVNPISQTFGGRLTMAQDLLKANQIQSPKQYVNMVATGQLDVLTDDDEADGMLILEENEALMENRPIQAVIVENHEDHIKGHKSQITQEAKEKDPQFVARVLSHIQEHLDLWKQVSMTNPGLLLATKQQPLPMPPPPPGLPAPGMQGPPPSGEAPQPNMPPPMLHPAGRPMPAPKQMDREIGGGQEPVVQKALEVKQPKLPKIAGTNERVTVPGVPEPAAI